MPPRIHYPNRIVLHRDRHVPETIDLRITGAGYTHELIEVTERVAGGHTESEIMPLADTVAVQDVLGEEVLGLQVARHQDASRGPPVAQGRVPVTAMEGPAR